MNQFLLPILLRSHYPSSHVDGPSKSTNGICCRLLPFWESKLKPVCPNPKYELTLGCEQSFCSSKVERVIDVDCERSLIGMAAQCSSFPLQTYLSQVGYC